MNQLSLERSAGWLDAHAAPDPAGPDVLQLELTAACDLRCIMCPLPHEARRGGSAARWDAADLPALDAALAEASGVELTGFGEILCHPDLLGCLRWLRGRNLAVQATTNGIRLTAELARALVEERLLDALCVSVDAATAETYERIRRGGDFAVVRRNVEALAATRAAGGLRLWLSFAAMAHNLAELPAFVRWAGAVGAERVIVQHVGEGPHTRGMGLALDHARAEAVLAEAGGLADELGVALDGRNLAAQGAAGYRPGLIKDCPFPWRHAFIKANRRVAACAMAWEDLDFADLGAPLGFRDIWRGEAYRRFRRRMASGETPPSCERCRYFGWREATLLAALGPALAMGPAQRGQLGPGWRDAEFDQSGQAFRWTRRRAAAWLDPQGRPLFELAALGHPRAPFQRGEIAVGAQRFAFDSHDLWGAPLRLATGEPPAGPMAVELALEADWNPQDVGIAGRRRLGLMVTSMRFVGDAAKLGSSVDAEDAGGQLARGWLPAETVDGRRARWMRERADLLLAAADGALTVEVMLPAGLASGRLQALVDGVDAGTRDLPADGRWRMLRFESRAARSPVRVELRAPDALPAPGDATAQPRLFGALLRRVRIAQSDR